MTKALIAEVFEKAGGRQRLRELLGSSKGPLSNQSLSDWLHNEAIPVRHCPAIHAITGIPLARLHESFRLTAAALERRANVKAGA